MAQYDFSDFDAPKEEEKKPSAKKAGDKYDFSDFHEGDKPQEDSGISMLQSGMEGLASGATIAPHILAGGTKTLMDLITGNVAPSDALDYYKHERDRHKEESEKILAANPKTAMAGQLIGGIVPAVATAGESLPSSATAMMRMAKAANVGGQYGAASGFLNGNADFAQAAQDIGQGNFGNALNQGKQGLVDTVNGWAGGTVAGGLFGAGGELLGKAGSAVANSRVGKYFSKGKQGINLGDIEKHTGVLEDVANELGDTMLSIRKAIQNNDYPAAIAELNKSNANVNIKNNLTQAFQKAEKMQDMGSEGGSSFDSAEKVKDYLLNFLEGKKTEVKAVRFTPQKTIETPSSASGLAELEAKLERIKTDHADQGVSVSTSIEPYVDANGKKMLRGSWMPDEPAIETTPPKVRFSSKDPEAALEKLNLIRSKAEIENPGAKYEVVQKGDLHHVVENPTSEMMEQAGPKFIHQPDMPEIPASRQVLPAQIGNEFKVGDVRTNPLTNLSLPQLVTVKQQINEELVKYKDNPRAFKILSDLKDQLGELIFQHGNDAYRNADTKYAAISQGLKKLGINPKSGNNYDFEGNELDSAPFKKLFDVIRKSGDADSTNMPTASKQLGQAMDNLAVARPDVAKELAPRVGEAAENYDMARDMAGHSLLSSLRHLSKFPAFLLSKSDSIANKAGLATNAVATEAGYATNALFKMPAEHLIQLADRLSTSGAGGTQIANILKEAASRDNVGRNALLFTVMQNPAYRKLLGENNGK